MSFFGCGNTDRKKELYIMSGKQNGFSKIPLARKIEALVLTAVTVIASMSVDWSSLIASADTLADKVTSLTNEVTLDTTSTDAPVLTMEVGGYGDGDNAKKYKAIVAAYMNIKVVSGSADYVVTVYQNPTNRADYTTGVAHQVKTGIIYSSTDNTQEDPEPFQPKELWDYTSTRTEDGLKPPVYLSSTETATIVVTFSNISEGAQIQYGTDSENNPFALSEEAVNSFDDAQIISKISQITAVTDEAAPGQSYDLSSNNIYLEPAYNRTIDLTLLSRIKTAGQIAVSDLSSSITITDQAAIDDNFILTPKATGENTIVAFSGENKVAIPLRVVDPKINYSAAVYTGAGFHITEPAPVCGNNTLTSGMDFYATYSGTANDGQTYTAASADQITKAGKYTVTLTGAGNYAGLDYTSPEFTIGTRDLSDKNTGIAVSAGAMVIDPATREVASYAGALTDNGTPLILGTDYTAEITRDQTSATKFSVKITGINNYSGERTFETTATTDDQIDLNTMVKGLMLTASQSDTANVPYYAFDGKPHNEPGIFFYDDEAVTHQFTLTQNTDYAYSIEDRNGAVVYDSAVATSGGAIEAGDYTVKIRGLNNYKGTISSRDYKVSDGNGGTRPQVLTIAPTKLTPGNIIVKLTGTTQFVANGKVQQPSGVTVDYVIDAATNTVRRLNEGVDYTKEFPQSVTKGNYSVKITGMGNFTADSVDFSDSTIKDQINPASNVVYTIVDSLDAATITLKVDTQAAGSSVTKDNADPTSDIWASAYSTPYDGDVTKKPVVTVNIGTDLEELKSDNSNKDTADYQVIYNTDSSKKAGTATLTVRGMHRFAGQPDITVSYTITPKTLPGLTIDSASQTKTYSVSGSGIKLDYGSYHVKDNGSELTAANLTSAELAAPKADEIAAKYPDADYYVTYENNKNAGNATVTAHGINNYAGETTATFTIEPLSLQNNNDFAIDPIPDQSYNYGAAVEPDKNNPDQVVVKYKGWYTLVKGTDYTLSYSGNTDKGKATVKVKGIGNFADDLSANFTIKARSLVDTTITYTIGGGTNKKTGTVTTQNLEPGYRTEYTGDKITPAIELKSGDKTLKAKDKAGTVKNPDYELDYGSDTVSAVGDHTVTVKGLNNYAGTSIIFTYTVTRKDFSTESFVVTPVKTASSTSIVAGVGAIKRYYQVSLTGKTLVPQVDASQNSNTAYDYSVKWTEPGASTTLGSNVIPSIAGEGYTLQITGRGNYKGTATVKLDSNSLPLMVGASLDAFDVIVILDRSNYSVPYLGSNLPAVYLDSSKLTSTNETQNRYNQNIVISGGSIGALAGPDYENGRYKNDTAKDYTVHFVPGTTATKDDAATELGSLPVNTQFKVRVSAVAGSKLFFGSHQTENKFTVSATNLSVFGARTSDYRAGKLTVSDPAASAPYVVSNGSVVSAAAISYEYTGSTITPKLSVTFQPVTTDSSKFKGTFAPINLLSYATVAPATIEANVASNKNFTLTANDNSGFSGTLNIPYKVTTKKITQEMIGWSGTPSAVYDGKSKKSAIEGMIQVTDSGRVLTKGEDYTYTYTLCDATGTAITISADESAFTNVGKIYVKVTGIGNYSDSEIGATPFEITAKSVNNVSISLNGQDESKDLYIKYTGFPVVPSQVEVFDETEKLIGSESKDGTGDYYYNADDPACLTTGAGIGVKTVTIYGKNNYAGTQKSRKFYVYGDLSERSVTTDGITDQATYILNDKGQPVEADSTGETIKTGASPLSLKNVKFKAGDTELNSDSYTVSVTTTTDTPASESSLQYPGKYIVTYTGAGESKLCTGTRKFTITVKGDLATAEVQGIESVYPYSENVSDERPEEADILVQLAGSGNKVSPDDYTITYDKAQAIEPNAQEGDITLTISPKKDSLYVGKFTKSYDIKYNLEDANIEATEGKAPVMGDTAADITKNQKITVTVAGKKLRAGTDYQIKSAKWENSNKTSRTASLSIVIGPDNGEKFSYNTCETTLEAEKKPIADATLSKPSETISYDGKDHLEEQNKAIKVKLDKKTLKLDEDYAVDWTDSNGKNVTSLTDAGTYTATIKGVYEYEGEATQKYTFTISPVNISKAKVEPKDANQEYYTGKAPALDYTVTVDGLTLTQDKDFTATITSPDPKPTAWNANTAVTVKIAAKGSNFTGDTTYSFTIKPINLADSTKLLSIKSTAVYNGKVQTPSFVIVRIDSSGKEIENGTLKEGEDYEITTTGSGFIDADKYDCVIKGKNSGNYTGELSYKYEIAPKSITDGSIKVSLDKDTWDYADGNEVKPAVTVTDSAITAKPGLTVDKDYKVTYENNKDSHASTGDGAPVVKITGNGNYTGERTENFQIGTDISRKSELKLEEDSFDYDGEVHTPAVEKLTLKDPSGKKLETLYADDIPASTCVTLSYQDENSSAKGTYTVTISGKGPYFGDVTASYEIKANKANGAEIDVALKGQSGDGSQTDSEGNLYYYYSGNKYTPDAVVKYVPDDNDDTQTKTLTGGSVAEDAVATVEADHPDWDYYLTYGDDNTNAGKGTVTVHLINNYSGTKTVRFEIKAVDLSDLTLKLHGTKEEFDGTAKTKDFELTGKNKAGQTLEDMTFAGTPDEQTTAAADKGLTVTFESNVSPGTAVILVAPISGGNFTGNTLNASFTIQGDLDSGTANPAVVSAAAIFRTGEEPDVEAGDITIDFVDNDGVSHVIRPETGWYTVSDPEPVDATDWTSASRYTVTVEPTKAGKAFLTGDRTVTGELSSSPTGLTIEGFKYSYQYTGAPIKPGKDDGVVVKTNGKALPSSFGVAYTYSSDAGDDCISIGKVKIIATVSYTDASGSPQTVTTDKDQYGLKASYRIVQRPIKTCNISMKDSVTYTGDELKPPITINTGSKELMAGTDYYTDYSNNTNPGIAKVVIHATSGGNFTGQATKTFNIYVASVTGATATSVSTTSAKISWNASDHVSGYRLNYLDGSGNVQNILTTATSANVTGLSTTDSTQVALQAYVKDSSGNTYYGPTNFLYAKTALATATVSGTANVSANNITWTNVTNANGYEVWRAEGDGGYELMRATVPQGTYTFRDTQVTSGTKYSYRIRAYKINTNNGTKYGYSEYSTPVTLTAR